LQEVFVRLSIRNCLVLMIVRRPDDRGTGMSTSYFFFLLYIGILNLVEETRGILSPKYQADWVFQVMHSKSKQNDPMCLTSHHLTVNQMVLFHWPLCLRHSNGSSRQPTMHATLLVEPGRSLLYCCSSGTIHRLLYQISATLQACLE
jgi:hypothetical protein